MDEPLHAPEAMDREKALILSALAAMSWCRRRDRSSPVGKELATMLMQASAWVSRTRAHHHLGPLRMAELVELLERPVGEWLPGGGFFSLVEDAVPTPI
jgi:DNA-binding transcriptional ArsR family regulator